MAMYTYTLVFIQIKSQMVMLNRSKSPWMGMWNGLGGKINSDETPLQSIQREIKEELKLDVDSSLIKDRGILTWNDFNAFGQGIHLFYVNLEAIDLHFPILMDEGIIDLKPIDWIIDSSNHGVAPNIKYFLKPMMEFQVEVYCIFESQTLIDVKVTKR
jgi:8-oxo-dGTP diphosphatase